MRVSRASSRPCLVVSLYLDEWKFSVRCGIHPSPPDGQRRPSVAAKSPPPWAAPPRRSLGVRPPPWGPVCVCWGGGSSALSCPQCRTCCPDTSPLPSLLTCGAHSVMTQAPVWLRPAGQCVCVGSGVTASRPPACCLHILPWVCRAPGRPWPLLFCVRVTFHADLCQGLD